MIDENPSPDDLERFNRDTAYCPECAAEVWDQAEICSSCGAYLHGDPSSRPRGAGRRRRLWITLVVLITVTTFLLLTLRLF